MDNHQEYSKAESVVHCDGAIDLQYKTQSALCSLEYAKFTGSFGLTAFCTMLGSTSIDTVTTSRDRDTESLINHPADISNVMDDHSSSIDKTEIMLVLLNQKHQDGSNLADPAADPGVHPGRDDPRPSLGAGSMPYLAEGQGDVLLPPLGCKAEAGDQLPG